METPPPIVVKRNSRLKTLPQLCGYPLNAEDMISEWVENRPTSKSEDQGSNTITTTTTDAPAITSTSETTSNSILMDAININKRRESSRPKGWKIFIPWLNHNKSVESPAPAGPQSINSDKTRSLLKLSIGKSQKIKPILPPLSKADKGKKTLVLDLDETLIHTAFKPIFEYDFMIRVEIKELYQGLANVYVIKRPGVEEFLQALSAKYEIVVFTASTKAYADGILDRLDTKGLIKHRLYREACTFYCGGLVKDLATLGRDLQKVVIVDNSPQCYILQPDNAVPISSFIDDKKDRELIDLIPFLSVVAELDDVTAALTVIAKTL